MKQLNENEIEVAGRTHKFDFPIYRMAPYKGGCCIITTQTQEPASTKNLYRIDSNGEILWRAENPRYCTNGYSGLHITEESLQAYHGDGFIIILDPETGKILSQEFVK